MKSRGLRRLIPFAKPHWWVYVIAVSLTFSEIFWVETRIPLIQRDAVDLLIKGGSPRALWPLVGLLMGLAVIEALLAFGRRNLLSRTSHTIERDIRNSLYKHLQSLHISFHDGWQTGQLLSRAVNDLHAVRRFIGFGAPFLLIAVFEFGVVGYRMFGLNRVLALVTMAGVLPVGYVSYYLGKNYRKLWRKIQDQEGDLSTTIEESASGIRIIKAFGRRPQMIRKFRDQARTLLDTNLEITRLEARVWPLFELAPKLLLVFILIYGGLDVIRGEMTPGELLAFATFLQMLVWPLEAFGWILAMSEGARTASHRIFEVFDTKPEIVDMPGASALNEVKGRISFNDVSFKYAGAEDWLLQDVNLEIVPGETLALVGKTGSGKTTLAMLIPRLYDVNEGSVEVDGRDVRDLTLSSLRSHIGVAYEDPILFSASVRENLVMGRPEATEEEIKEALETAQASFVYDLPWGLDTRVGEQGHTLSGGQRQRLALARAVLGRPQILVLDDPMSSVDVHTEEQIEQALKRVLKGVTALIVVHRPSTIALADRVALLEGGTIVAVGKHADLMESNELYRSILSQEAEDLELPEAALQPGNA